MGGMWLGRAVRGEADRERAGRGELVFSIGMWLLGKGRLPKREAAGCCRWDGWLSGLPGPALSEGCEQGEP